MKKEKKKKKKFINIENIEIIILISVCIFLAISVGLNRIQNSNFYPTNGDFQNYNPISRVLNGQIPYKDFAAYLGTGHLVLLSSIQLLIGNNYTLSLFVTNMTTNLILELTILIISFLILKNKKQSLYSTIMITLLFITRPEFFRSLVRPEFITTIQNFAIAPGNSARLIRIAIAPITIILICIGFKVLNKTKNKFMVKHNSLVKKIYMAIIAGIGIMWSNDGGIATYITVSFVYFLFLIKENKKDIKSILKYTLIYIGISLISFFTVLTIVTRGNILSWFEFTLGVSSYQKWYYGEAPYKKNFSLCDIDLSVYMIIMIIIAIYYIYKLLKSKEKKEVLQYGLLSIMIISPILSAYLYQFLSGSYSRDMVFLVIMILAISYIIQFLINKNKNKLIHMMIKLSIIIISVIGIISTIRLQMVDVKEEQKKAIYIEKLGGYFTKLGDSIQYAVNRIGKEKIFSTYASAVDTATNQFQPTGTDNIIHCLGDKQREKYLDIFKQGDFKYVVTTDRDYNSYRYWIKNANWFFYRELYKDYKPVFATEYSVYWEKTDEKEKIDENVNVTIDRKSKNSQIIKVKTQNKKFSGVVDVKINYESHFKKDFWKNLNINRYVYVDDITGKKVKTSGYINYNIPSKGEKYYIPITIVDGEGEVAITSYPTENTTLKIKSAEVLDIYDVNFKYCVLSNQKEIEGNVLYIDKTNENKTILKNVKKIKIAEIEQNVIDYVEENKYIKLEVDANAQTFAYPNFFEVIK